MSDFQVQILGLFMLAAAYVVKEEKILATFTVVWIIMCFVIKKYWGGGINMTPTN